MKKLILLLSLLLCCLLVLAACDEDGGAGIDPNHTHEWSEWVVKREPTCIEAGVERRMCDCGEVEVRDISATGLHTYGTDNRCTVCEHKRASYTEGLAFTAIEGGSAYAVSGLGSATDVTELVIPYYHEGKPVTSIGDEAFYGCTGLQTVTFGENSQLTSIGYGAFYRCTGLTSITIPEGVTSIGYWAFSGCTGLTSITIPDSVSSIGYGAFYGCTGLTSITIPDSVTSIGERAFEGCTDLTEIHYQGTASAWQQIRKSTGWNYNTGEYVIYCTDGEIAKDGTVTMK